VGEGGGVHQQQSAGSAKHLLKNTFTPEDVVDTVPMIRYYMVGDLTAKDKADFQKFIDFSVQTGTLPEKVDVTKFMQTF
jgi:NitT/TauT family transport system substrate-binding protein